MIFIYLPLLSSTFIYRGLFSSAILSFQTFICLCMSVFIYPDLSSFSLSFLPCPLATFIYPHPPSATIFIYLHPFSSVTIHLQITSSSFSYLHLPYLPSYNFIHLHLSSFTFIYLQLSSFLFSFFYHHWSSSTFIYLLLTLSNFEWINPQLPSFTFIS